MSHNGVVEIVLERAGGLPKQQFEITLRGDPFTANGLLEMADHVVRLWAMKSMPAKGEAHPIHFRAAFSQRQAVEGIFDMTADCVSKPSAFSGFLASFLVRESKKTTIACSPLQVIAGDEYTYLQIELS